MSETAALDIAATTDAAPRDPLRLVAGLDLAAFVRSTGLDPELVLGPTLFKAVLQVVRSELQTRLAGPTPARTPWMTPPAVARVTGVPVKTIRTWARLGRIPRRLKNRSADHKQQKYLVNVNDVVAAAEQLGAASAAVAGETPSVHDRAREILAARAAKGR